MGSVRVGERELREWGREFGARLSRPAVIALSGELGSGKTTLVQAIAQGLGVELPVTSPTFALVQRYDSPGGPMYHVDAYRLKPGDDVRDLGFDEMLSEPGAVVCVEWPERLGDAAPPFTHRLRLEHNGDEARRLTVE
ncbi:MAG TPA: tRNA (adenosine(37)-N6)-threonylcarbamoyltransferase complex ATPase subunit type 1 TsaE [Gemmatimonadales bacterium]|nr:tRNA (adenosine(37)-N6)-threonylcarbamoyltransferase complex ATPase subunit type 1 TsaE [Gemmatimonadales bacterium]